MHNKRAVWSMDMVNVMPHCMGNNKGLPRGLWDFYDYDTSDGLCREDHRANPKVIADVEWLRFIRTFKKAWTDEETNPFIDNYENERKRLILNGYHTFVVNGHEYPYAEEYWMIKPNVVSQWSLIFAVYIDNDGKRANITCFDLDYVAACDDTYVQVQDQFASDAATVF
jgi:hypothetical protein